VEVELHRDPEGRRQLDPRLTLVSRWVHAATLGLERFDDNPSVPVGCRSIVPL
jgi:hypothetical protein